jgi:hypothetical protein
MVYMSLVPTQPTTLDGRQAQQRRMYHNAVTRRRTGEHKARRTIQKHRHSAKAGGQRKGRAGQDMGRRITPHLGFSSTSFMRFHLLIFRKQNTIQSSALGKRLVWEIGRPGFLFDHKSIGSAPIDRVVFVQCTPIFLLFAFSFQPIGTTHVKWKKMANGLKFEQRFGLILCECFPR